MDKWISPTLLCPLIVVSQINVYERIPPANPPTTHVSTRLSKKPFNGFLRAFALLSGEHAKTVKNPRKNDCFKVVKSLPCDDFFAGLLKQTKITAPLGLQISKIGGRFRLSRDLEVQTHICVLCGGGNATLWYTKDSSFSSSWILRIGGVGIVRAISKPFCKLRKPLEWNIHQNPNFNLQIRAIFQIQNWQF